MKRGFARLQKVLKVAPIVPPVVLAAFFTFLVLYIRRHGLVIFEPRGPIAEKERNLMIFALLLSVIVVVPVFIMLFSFAWRYREKNTKAVYSPELAGGRIAETVWWLIPGILILILSVVTWNSSHALDPFRPLVSSVPPLRVQVISLDWKWLFIYPGQNTASVNTLYVPVNTPIDFTLTSDAPMNSFWIPQLGGQIYTMPGMSTQLHLLAAKTGTYRGQSANISGVGFAGMNFETHAVSAGTFAQWIQRAHLTAHNLSQAAYNRLARPSQNNRVVAYGAVENGLYDNVINKYLVPGQAVAAPASLAGAAQ